MMRSVRLAALAVLALHVLGAAAAAQERPGARVRGTVHDSLRANGPLAGARVIIQNVAATTVTDSRGRFDLRDVPVGTHRISFFHPWLDSLRLAAPLYEFELTASGMHDLHLSVPSFASLSNYLCGEPQDSATTVIFGQVRAAEDGRPVADAEARVEWFEVSLGGPEGLTRGERVASARSDSTGAFRLCGVPNDIETAMRVASGAQATGPVVLALAGEPVAYRDLTISLTDSAARLTVSGEEDAEVRGAARLSVVVSDGRGKPIEGAAVGVRGAALATRTDPSGRARLVGVPAGSQTVVVRSVGRTPVWRVVDLVPGHESQLEVESSSSVTVLPEVVVRGLRRNVDLEAYERRRRSGTGHFLGADELRRRGGGVNALLTVPGVTLPLRKPGEPPPLPRVRANSGGYCTPTILVDGMMMLRVDGWEFDAMMRDARRVEVYTRSLMTPGDLMVISDCGVIAIWFR